MIRHQHEILIIGGGIAGLSAALAAGGGGDVAVISKVFPTRSHSVAAQGGTAAALGNMEGDSWEWHFYDTVKGSDFLGDQDAQALFCREAVQTAYYLEHLGVPFSRTGDGRILQRYFGGHYSKLGQGPAVRRACVAADRIGHAMVHTLYGACLEKRTRFYSDFLVTHLLFHDQGCCGCVAWDLSKGEIHTFHAKLILLAAGGYARIFRFSTNSAINTGDGLGMILEEGLPLEDMELVQFHPTGLYPWGFLMSEGVRGEGGYLLNNAGERFMKRYAPERMELAPRDVTARAIQSEIEAGRGVEGKPCVHLDLRHVPADIIESRLPQIQEMALKFSGIDVTKSPIPVAPAAHYSMGGIPVTIDCEVLADGKKQVMPGLFAAGECACVSVHGANRLGTNSTMECAVFGKRAGEKMAGLVKRTPYLPLPEKRVEAAAGEIDRLFARAANVTVADLRQKLQASMTEDCGLLRHRERLERQIALIDDLKRACQEIGLKGLSLPFNVAFQETWELKNMLLTAEAVARCALARTESRGAHCRLDFPQRDDENWLKHTLIWKDGSRLDYKPVVITRFPPAERKF